MIRKIILASTSPRRVELLQSIGLNFETVSPQFDENMIGLKFSYEAIESIALSKGKSIKNNITSPALIISADTVVVFGSEVLGKPTSEEDAIKMVTKLNNSSHKVVTSIALIDSETNEETIESTTSVVTFNNLSKDDIHNYIKDFKPFDKAGSYGIQELPEHFVKEIQGDFDNIVGLPTRTLIKMINNMNKSSDL